MTDRHTIFMPNGTDLATREAWMMMHPGFNADYKPGDLIELKEGIFILDDELVPIAFDDSEDIDRPRPLP